LDRVEQSRLTEGRAARDSSAASADLRTALYSLGALWLYLLTGQPPRPGDAQPWAMVESEVPEAHLKLLERLLAARPEDRMSSPAPLVDALGVAAAGAASPEEAPKKAPDKELKKELPTHKPKFSQARLAPGARRRRDAEDEPPESKPDD